MKAQPIMVRRQKATAATAARFQGRAFEYGRFDCVQMVAFHLRKFGVKVLLSKGGSYRSALGAAKAIKRAGFENLAAALGAMGLEPIAPAAAIMGDIIALPQGEGAQLEALTIALGNGRVLGWHEHAEGAIPMQPHAYLGAWRAPV